ncbi:hypothetical protein FRX94_03125 [Corynebacterium canis]|uniref:C4-type zinc ribbon domain-containing protein n=1 Tax=Corynebacterium canis TaxID=679663 RepID=A0A5C5UT56_9CORY|nr:C4-type zinc ribbon domain-containing protein [Corynebacterium canis]TWT28575.1 hypothetical protein FRX94_03125 [Corynebacterium canis]WJY75834.1 Putative zinc ribbon domain protein [Corynebacterium canis]
MKLAPEKQRDLLELATLSVVNPAAIPASAEQREVDQLTAEMTRIQAADASITLSISDMEAEVRRIQLDMSKLQRRESAAKGALGAVTDVEKRRDLRHELAAAVRRLDDLRGELKETHDELHALRASHDRFCADLEAVRAKLEAAQRAVVPADDSQRIARIDELKLRLDAAVLEAYAEQCDVDGIGVAKFSGRACGGCHIILPPAVVSRIRNAPEDELPQCPDCGVYLVR